MTRKQRTYRGVPAEERRALRRAALLEAGLELLGTSGWQSATVRAVCALAGLNDRYFYESFTDRDALLLAVVDDQAAQGTAAILDAAAHAPRDIAEIARASTSAVLDFLTDDPRRARILGHEFPTHALLQQRRGQIIHTLAGFFTAQTRDLVGDATLSDTDLSLTAYTLTAGLWDLTAAWLRGDVPISRDHLADYTVALLLTTADLAAPLHRRLT